MLRKNIKIVKYCCLFFLILVAGILYSCNRTNDEDSDFYTTMETDVDLEEGTSDVTVDTADMKVETVDSKEAVETPEYTTIYVHVCGAVVNPGVYEVNTGTRVFEVINLAGGVTNEGAPDALNQAELVEDGQKILVPTLEEAQTLEFEDAVGNQEDSSKGGLVNINKAGKEELMTLPGIGDSKAQSIIAYREENGNFKTIEDIKNITGIKDGLFNKIKDYISVK